MINQRSNEHLKLIKQFKSYLAKRGYKFRTDSIHILGNSTLRAEVYGIVNSAHFNFVKFNRSNCVVDLYVNQSESDFKRITDNLF